ncbi:MAG: LCP family protein [Actinomycetes bacterium]
MESTVYRRDSTGALIGTPETQAVSKPPEAANRQPPKTRLNAKKLQNKLASVSLPKSNKSGKRYPRWIRIIRNVIIAYLACYIFLGFHAASAFHKIAAGPVNSIAVTSGTNWLLVGSDSRDGLSKAEQRTLHTGGDFGPQRTDTIMLIHIGQDGTTLISLPRDSYVTIPAHIGLDGSKVTDRKNKINTAYGKGGAPLLVETIERNTGLHIDHFMEVGFKGIRDITNAVGGVNMCIPNNITDKNSGLNLTAGCQKLDGTKALGYVRMRYADPKGDLGRVERQQQYLSAVMHQVIKPAVFLNPFALYRLIGAGTDSVVVGKGDGIKDIAQLASAMRSLSNGKGKLITVPVSNPDATTAAGSSVLWDKAAAAKLFKSLGAK